MDVLDEAWLAQLVAASAQAPARPGLDGAAALCVGDRRAVLEIRDGRITAARDGDAEVEVPLSAEQLAAVASGELSLAVAYMKGDVKPAGSSGALAVLLELLEDPASWRPWRS